MQAVQYFPAWDLEAYVAYAVYSLQDDTDLAYQDASATMFGLRWKF